MLKTKPLTQLLSQSISPNVSSALLFTPSGSLLATGTSPIAPDAKKARTNAALAANIWTAYDRVAAAGDVQTAAAATTAAAGAVDTDEEEDRLKSLTLELSDYNMHIQLVAPRVLLCLIGPRQPTRHSSSRSSAHSHHDPDLRLTPPGSAPRSGGGGGSAGPASTATASVSAVSAAMGAGGSLGVLKTQAQGLVAYLEKELKGYELPEGL